jgi:serine protease Do
MKWRSFIIGTTFGVVLIAAVLAGAVTDRFGKLTFLDKYLPAPAASSTQSNQSVKLLTEESAVIDVAKKVSPSVVTVSIKTTQRYLTQPNINPFLDPFGQFFTPPRIGTRNVEQDIGSGFIVSSDGLIVTNKHVVSDTSAEYKVVTNDNQEYQVQKIDRDPLNDLAILKIDATGLQPVELGDSDHLEVGQFVTAIGTALGEFRHTVTTGVISGLGRGITAGDALGGASEELDNVIQTDAAINPGNSGGPLLNSAGQVVGVNVAIAQGSENIGFALPINIVKESLDKFQQQGGFGQRAYLGVRYMMISQPAALANEVPEGAYVQEVVSGSPAESAGVKNGDIIVKIAGQSVKYVKGGLA